MTKTKSFLFDPNIINSKFAAYDLSALLCHWHKKTGDDVQRDETLFEIETVKAIADIPAPFSGRIARICVPEGATISRSTKMLEYVPLTYIPKAPVPLKAKPPKPSGTPVFDSLWDAYQERFEATLDRIKQEVASIVDENEVPRRLRVAAVEGRIKGRLSTLDKCRRLSIDPVSALTELPDIIGVRIICYNIEDVYQVARSLENRYDGRILEESFSDQIQVPNAKTGYRSLHMVLVENVTYDGNRFSLKCEIQIRTLAQDLWARLSHADLYKNADLLPSDLLEKMKGLSDILAKVDEEASEIRHLVHHHTSSNFLPYRMEDPLDADSFLSFLRHKYGIAIKGFWLQLHLANFRRQGVHNLSELDAILSNKKLRSNIEKLLRRVFGPTEILSILDHIYFSVIANKAGLSAAQHAMESCLHHVAELEAIPNGDNVSQ
jgi:putative GTP pyrophosphokinase